MRSSSATAPARPSNPSSTASAPPLPTARPTPQRVPAKTDAATNRGSNGKHGTDAQPPAEQKILFQKFFKSVGPRTYAAQIKQARNGNYFLVLTEGKRDPETDEVRKTKILVFSEDFKEFFHLLTDAVTFLREHPMPDEIKRKRDRFWAKRNGEQKPRAADGKSVKPPPAPISTRSRGPENKNRR